MGDTKQILHKIIVTCLVTLNPNELPPPPQVQRLHWHVKMAANTWTII